MIDDPTQLNALMQKIEAALPIPAEATSALIRTLKASKIKISSKTSIQIDKVFYMGDEGGIACALKIPGSGGTVTVVSLTHLRIPSHHPLASEVRAYQIARTEKLKELGK